ncbi:pyrroline-5-carboxylate reductase [Enterococcus phoeniculicola]|uniref:Pyrroline-5-carboxylate reductase n=1 Tax=Enterococcus phoeniculicola ATCC BAA-412 TaxID=1158610 RepID=R3X5A9_9ENTE|nr:pyrroline-5-carboxylate reductase [Enterococcus phoeniculicola]EOL49235.1 pyrroline-5-carboxylate reductase [Enterococcus phoeniculicola ATCC BAA-412]EOT71347.1 pyrroline-5-carboxylate reductase [Enterococcus phoeniculicola ATCC BAA-412]OJG69636.1 pyrroline-5-carboxylate reductase [Enterococcus phoeniculicola]
MKIGFLGAGNMASAIVEGIIKKEFVKADEVYLYDILTDKVQAFAASLGAHAVAEPKELIETVEVLVLAVKPNVIKGVLDASKETIQQNSPLIVSIAAGTPLDALYEVFETTNPVKIVRVMPNVNALVGEGAAAICGNDFTTKEEVSLIVEMFNAVGQAWELEEHYFSNFTALAGSSPAYAYLFIDSIARAGVKNGMAKDKALEIAAQAVLGSAKMIIESQENPWTLIDRVCSPGGTTVAGLVELENNAFISTVIKGIDATIAKDQEMSK